MALRVLGLCEKLGLWAVKGVTHKALEKRTEVEGFGVVLVVVVAVKKET